MSKESVEITINTSRCYKWSEQWNDNSHISSLTWQFLMKLCFYHESYVNCDLRA